MAISLTVASGFSVSSAFTLDPSDRPWALEVPSMAGNAIRVQFTSTSGGGSFGALWPQPTMDALVNSSTVRPAFAVIEFPPTPWGRIQLGTATSDLGSWVLYPVNRRR